MQTRGPLTETHTPDSGWGSRAASDPDHLWMTSSRELLLRPWVLRPAWRWLAACLLIGFGSLAVSSGYWMIDRRDLAVALWFLIGTPAAIGSLVAARLHVAAYVAMVPLLALTSFFVMGNVGLVYLSAHGEVTDARVEAVSVNCIKSCTKTWHLVGPSGRSIGMTDDLPDSTRVGSRVRVVYDPRGVVGPEPVSDVETATGGAVPAAAVLIVASLSVVLVSVLVNLMCGWLRGPSSQHPATNWAILSPRERRAWWHGILMIAGILLGLAGVVAVIVGIPHPSLAGWGFAVVSLLVTALLLWPSFRRLQRRGGSVRG